MFNMIKADMKRLNRGKWIWVFFGWLIVMAITSPGGNTELAQAGVNSAYFFMRMIFQVVVCAMGISIVVIGEEHSKGYGSTGGIKNILTHGFSRTKYYASKLVLCLIYALLFYLVYVVGGVIASGLVYGFGGSFADIVATGVFAAAGAQILLLFGFTSLCVAIAFAIPNTTASSFVMAGFMFVPALILAFLINQNESFNRFMPVLIYQSMQSIARQTLEHRTAMLVAAGYIVISTVIGFLVFRRSEIK